MSEQANGFFYKDTVHNEAKSKKEGRAIFDERVLCQITIPGDPRFKHVDLATEANKERFPEAWTAFKNTEGRAVTGTPIEEWPAMTASRVMELKSLEIYSVEDLAGLNESFVGRLGPGARDLIEQAKEYLSIADAVQEVKKKKNIFGIGRKKKPGPKTKEETEGA